MGLVATISMFAITSQAKAAESPLDKLMDLYRGATKKAELKKEKIEYKREESIKSPTQLNNQEKQKEKTKRVPEVVDDPKRIERAAEFAAEKTGIRKDFLMGALVVESNLGRNYGECTYKEVADGAKQSYENGRLSGRAWQTFKARQEIITDIADDLNYDPDQLKVSCNPAYAGTGGAMGIPQFMPDIWMAYKDRIGAIVGKENPDPWDIEDGVVAMALLLSDTPGVTDHDLYAERNAAKMYLSGTTSGQYNWYADQIVYWSKNYKDLLV